jgi:hypothetical protein
MSLPNELLPIGLLGTGTGAAVEEGYNIERSQPTRHTLTVPQHLPVIARRGLGRGG